MLVVRLFALTLLAGLLFAMSPAKALAQRDVLLNVCNEAGFSVAIAAAYRTTSTESRTLRSWFLVEPGQCLEGAVNNVVGHSLDIHVMSGEWRWPARSGDAVYCTPAASTFAQATGEPCSGASQARNYVRLPIGASRYRGIGQVDYRVRCDRLSVDDAALCVGAPRDERGLAQIVRTLEVCHGGRGEADTVVLLPRADGAYDLVARQTLASGECADLYRGFPAGNRVLVGAVGRNNEDVDRRICMPDGVDGPFAATDAACPTGRVVHAEAHVFRTNVSRFTAYLQ
ncbi:DUF1036 domain-containing protein [Maricaulis sp.]|uniref:DUF1036 domain-containing protein n=1 Tax=Maricaulis sp. TaxID=1486257 RepID=UPI003A8DB4C8